MGSDNLPVAPVHLAATPVHDAALPIAPVDTPAVVEAKAAFFKAYNAAKSGVVKRSAQSVLPQTYAGLPALNYAGYQHYPYSILSPLLMPLPPPSLPPSTTLLPLPLLPP